MFLRVGPLVLVVVLSGCLQASVTKCPDVDCPANEVCDGQGGCALPEQLSVCHFAAEGDPCQYTNNAAMHVDGACSNGICVPIGCGNGLVTSNEVCDDGNTVNGDGCSADCQSNETCGNGVDDPAKGEQCDDGNTVDGDGCQANCTNPRCGDGVVDASLNEQCDNGAANAVTPDAGCRPNCQLPRCGDGVTDVMAGEICDDGNNQANDGCSGDCKSNETCGNHIVDVLFGEKCDDGNTMSGDGCSANCKSTEVCGNGVKDTTLGEVCDDNNTVSGDGCSSDCHSLETCGNNIVDTATEECDKGGANSNLPNSACRTTCKLPKCGDMIIDNQRGEACDNGPLNANTPNSCRLTCQLPRCGDNIKDTGETCDDGNSISGDGCSADCNSLETCGNGVLDFAKGEQCDAGALNSNNPNAPCRTNCKLPRCGDGIPDSNLGEGCDAGAANSNTPNAACRPNCQPQRCGDNINDNTKGEVCDDGNVTNGDGCSADCKSNETCGNGIVDVAKSEQCDSGAANANTPNAPCRTTCKLPKCGDGIRDDVLLGEGCDAGAANANTPNAACRTSCQPRRCGDNIRDNLAGEVCDDGNTAAGDGCSPDCVSNETCGNGVIDFVKAEQCDDGNGRTRDGCSACKPEVANVLTPNVTPNERDSQAIVYDGARQRVVMYGGWTVNGNLADTWEWDGTSWTQIRTAHSPGPRLDASVAYDPVRHRVVLFGGYSASYTGFRGETWEYDGVDWTLKTPTASPPALASAAMSFDGQRGHLLLYGGRSNDPTQGTATWEYTGATWTKLAPAMNPGVREGARMAYDAKDNYTILLGGGDNHMWKWDGTNWIDGGAQASFTNTGYDSIAMVFDPTRQVMVAWDGNQASTFEWNGAAWSAVAGAPQAAAGSTYSYVLFAYDVLHKQTILFGGYGLVNGSSTDDYDITWLRTGTAWAQPPAFVEPLPRYRATAAYDPIRRKVVLFGGDLDFNEDGAQETWEWDGAKWATGVAATQPPRRGGTMMDYDTKTRTVMLFGGDGTVGTTYTSYADLWSYNGATWTQPAASTGRTGVRDSGMAYDSFTDRVITFAGQDVGGGTYNALDTTMYWDATGWHTATPATKPPPREDFAMAYDPVRKRTVVFGGTDDNFNLVSDVWEFDGANTWAKVSPLAGPDPRTGLEMAFDPDLSRVLVFGNSGSLSGEDLWEWDGTAWNQRTVNGTITPRYREAVAYDSAHHELLVFSGEDNNGNITGGTQRLAYWPNQTVEACTSSQIDYDNDGLAGCADTNDCWSVCTPLCPPGATCPAGSPRCGDGACTANENCNLCPTDCGACAGGTCGDFHCDPTETHATCPNDC